MPQSLFDLPMLQSVSLVGNQLSGPLEDIRSPLTSSIRDIFFNDNQLTGPIPKSFFQLTNLNTLSLGSNNLSGTIELSSIWRLKNLSFIDLSNNLISLIDVVGETTPSSGLPNINYLYLASCNLTKLPGALRYLDTIVDLDLSSNQISGVIPSWVLENWKDFINVLNLSHNMFNGLEKSPSLVHMPQLTVLDLSFNRIEGNVPIPITLGDKVVLDYSKNNFSSILQSFGSYLTNTVYLDLSNNKLYGHIPSSVCHATKLETLELSYNSFSGSIPSCLLENGNLGTLKLRENQLQGMLPDNIKEGCMIQSIDLNANQLEGRLPRSLSNCQSLQLLDVGNNLISDLFPSWLGISPKLSVLVLRSNKFYGTIMDVQGDNPMIHFPSLQILDLASNNFSGNLPQGLFNKLKSMMEPIKDEGQVLGYETNSSIGFYRDIVTITYKGFDIMFTKILKTFKVIDFSNNSLDGPVPESIGTLVSLHGLNMSYNNFMGKIPAQLANLSRLESLDLSWNQLSGEIPHELTSLTYLAWLNLSYNNLTGRIPQEYQFSSFPISSFEGNVNLCGIPLSKQCDTLGSTSTGASAPSESNSLWQDRLGVTLLFTFSGLGFGVGFALSVVLQPFCHIERWNCKHW